MTNSEHACRVVGREPRCTGKPRGRWLQFHEDNAKRSHANTEGWSPRTRLEHASVNTTKRLLSAVQQRHRQRHQVRQQVCSTRCQQSARVPFYTRPASDSRSRLQDRREQSASCRGQLPANSNEPRMHSTTLFAACNAVINVSGTHQTRLNVAHAPAIFDGALTRKAASRCRLVPPDRADVRASTACSSVAEQHTRPGHVRVLLLSSMCFTWHPPPVPSYTPTIPRTPNKAYRIKHQSKRGPVAVHTTRHQKGRHKPTTLPGALPMQRERDGSPAQSAAHPARARRSSATRGNTLDDA